MEMPTGTGKTVCLLSLIISYIKGKKPTFKLIYCTRTIVEMEKTLEELKFVLKERSNDFPEKPTMNESNINGQNENAVSEDSLSSPVLALCLSSRKNMCIHPEVSKEDDRERVDSKCRQLTASWVREREGVDSNMHINNGALMMSNNVTDIEDLHKNLKVC